MDFEAIGTSWHISTQLNTQTKRQVNKVVERFDKTYSRFREDSWVCSTLSKKGEHRLPKDAYTLLSFYKKLFITTKGKVTPLVGKMLEQMGYDKKYSFHPKSVDNIPNFLEIADFDKQTIRVRQPGLLFDFGAAGKGYLVDIIATILDQAGTEEYLINAGGDIFTKGASRKVGLEDPRDSKKAIGVVIVKNEAICGSSPNRRAWANYHHIVNPATKKSTTHIHAVWVKAASCMEADGIATALFFVDRLSLEEYFNFSCAIMKDKMIQSPSFNADIFI